MKLLNPTIEKLALATLNQINFNRGVKLKHMTQMLNSMMQYGILRVPVVVRTSIFGKKGDYIIDGQHLIAALNKADHKITDCIVIEDNDITRIINTMAVLNNTNSVWKIDDYVNAYCAMPGKEDYRQLKVHHLATGFNFSVSAKILSGTSGFIKCGKFKINCTDIDEMTKNLVDITSLYDTNNSKFMLSYITFSRNTKNYDHKKFMQLAAKAKKNFLITHDNTLMTNAFHELYK